MATRRPQIAPLGYQEPPQVREYASAPGRAMAEFGQTLSNVAEIFERRSDAADRVAFSAQITTGFIDLYEAAQQDPDYKTLISRYKENSKKLYDTTLKKVAPREQNKEYLHQIYLDQHLSYYNNIVGLAAQKEQRQTLANLTTSLGKIAMEARDVTVDLDALRRMKAFLIQQAQNAGNDPVVLLRYSDDFDRELYSWRLQGIHDQAIAMSAKDAEEMLTKRAEDGGYLNYRDQISDFERQSLISLTKNLEEKQKESNRIISEIEKNRIIELIAVEPEKVTYADIEANKRLVDNDKLILHTVFNTRYAKTTTDEKIYSDLWQVLITNYGNPKELRNTLSRINTERYINLKLTDEDRAALVAVMAKNYSPSLMAKVNSSFQDVKPRLQKGKATADFFQALLAWLDNEMAKKNIEPSIEEVIVQGRKLAILLPSPLSYRIRETLGLTALPGPEKGMVYPTLEEAIEGEMPISKQEWDAAQKINEIGAGLPLDVLRMINDLISHRVPFSEIITMDELQPYLK